MKRKACEHQKADAFSSRYPNISSWVRDGWIEIGRDDYSRSMVRIMDEGGMVWEVTIASEGHIGRHIQKECDARKYVAIRQPINEIQNLERFI
jgi:hypothetical protein